ncbi:hypothetical protein [Methylobacterium oxalidis]|uniref:Curli production assembly/transport component CsgF n=1 Tax=Methylobacterium oxalidis TaxID=944322 RepID=A0A512J1S6_9HYPH|nr:hypothetical protein [Methylobacterium oxalidis]GEP03911.1 hypothetical protein MOX02_19490 [Methylobacterium oxalidis]GJE31213.1 hypothetical protein LDDCCGHA_1389 [Methylobacterium oxalidis]GLS65230.1 hypothetical protein GCM10007888_36120 [Methylobacterium oxalidis]
MTRALLAGLALLNAGPALAQILPGTLPPGRPGVVVQTQPNTTGNSRDIVIAPGATGAETITTNSAAGGNASFPERAIPNGSANGGGGGSR